MLVVGATVVEKWGVLLSIYVPLTKLLVNSLFLSSTNTSVIDCDIQTAEFLDSFGYPRVDRVLFRRIHFNVNDLDIFVLLQQLIAGRAQCIWSNITESQLSYAMACQSIRCILTDSSSDIRF